MQKLIRKLPKRIANCELRTANSNPAIHEKIAAKPIADAKTLNAEPKLSV